MREALIINGAVKEGDPTYMIEAMVSFCMTPREQEVDGEASRTAVAKDNGRKQRLDKLVIFVSKVSSSSSSMMLRLLLGLRR
jgi:hypothetical protein